LSGFGGGFLPGVSLAEALAEARGFLCRRGGRGLR